MKEGLILCDDGEKKKKTLDKWLIICNKSLNNMNKDKNNRYFE